jgi:hypothetical protein
MLNLFAPPAGLLGDQEEQVRQQMQQQGLLGLAAGLFEAGAPSRQRQSLGGSAIRGLMAGQQAAQGTFDQTLKAMTLRQQMEETKRKADREARGAAAIQNLQLGMGGAEGAPATQGLDLNSVASIMLNPDVPKDYKDSVKSAFELSQPPAEVRKLEAFMQRPELFAIAQQYAQASRPITNVTTNVGQGRVGTIPPGFELREDPATSALSMVPIPGGPVERQMIEDAEKARGRQEQQARAGGTVVQDLQRALNIIQTSPAATGRTAAATAELPGIVRAETDYQAAEGMIQSALSNVGLDTLQQMRENSPTGGALGQVPIQQQKRLEQVLGSLDLTQRREIVEDNVKRVINIYMDIIHGSKQQVEDSFNRGEITEEQRKIYGFRHNLSFDELGRPLPKGKKRSLGDIFGGPR